MSAARPHRPIIPTEELAAGDLLPLLRAPWWKPALQQFSGRLDEGRDPVLLLYGADSDGFAASYFLELILEQHRGELEKRPVWNFDYTFGWLSEHLVRSPAGLIVCLDVPIQREVTVLREVTADRPVAIYDHHVDRPLGDGELPNVTYVNSRLLDASAANHPSAAFAASLAAELLGGLDPVDLVVLFIGLVGDRAERRYPALTSYMTNELDLRDGDQSGLPGIRRYVGLIDALFQARIGQVPQDVQGTLARRLHRERPLAALAGFAEDLELPEARRAVDDEIDRAVTEMTTKANGQGGDLLYSLLPWMKTFGVGPAASRLARLGAARVVCLGFFTGVYIEYELRTPPEGEIDLTEVLKAQRRRYAPMTSGGHPNAAGAQIPREDAEEFERSLRAALTDVTSATGH